MTIEIYCEKSDTGTPIEIANALIKNRLNNVTDFEIAEIRKRELAEIAEHIQVFLKYSEI